MHQYFFPQTFSLGYLNAGGSILVILFDLDPETKHQIKTDKSKTCTPKMAGNFDPTSTKYQNLALFTAFYTVVLTLSNEG
jgi:hypothetical protein